jgi:hypothetical protein
LNLAGPSKAFSTLGVDNDRVVVTTGGQRLQLLHKPFAEMGDSVMIGMLLGTMQEKVLESQVEGSSFGFESTPVA